MPAKYILLGSKKLEIEGTPSAIFFIKKPRYDYCSVSRTMFIYITTK